MQRPDFVKSFHYPSKGWECALAMALRWAGISFAQRNRCPKASRHATHAMRGYCRLAYHD